MRNTLRLSLLLALAAGTALPAHAAKYKINWLLAHKNLDYFEEAAASFKKTVEKGSHGDIAVSIVTAASDEQGGAPGQAQTPSEIAAAVASGRAEMGHSFTDVMGGIDQRFWAFEAPYLFRGYRHMEGVIEGPVGADLLAGLGAHGMVGLSLTYSGGASGVATVGRELRGPKDLKGLKVGVYGDAVNAAWLKGLGATPVAVGHRLGDILPMSRDGSLDAVVTTWRNFERSELGQRFKRVSLMGSTYLVSVTYMNKKFYDSLPAEYRALITRASQETARIERAKTILLNEQSKRAMLAAGIQPVHLTEDARSAFAKALRPAYRGPLADLLGKDLVERIEKTPDGPRHPLLDDGLARR